jgi:cytosine/adenosine deaminase-related metal-dependent hydrolase
LDDNLTPQDRFEAAYTTGIVEEPVAETAAAEEAVGPPRTMLAAQEPFALRGCVLAPYGKIEDGHVVVEADGIAEVGEGAPDGSLRVIETGGVILPGLIDLHGHPEYDVFSAWEPPQRYENRYRWRDSEVYARVIKEPWHELVRAPSLRSTLTRYAEARALVGGVTAIQGASAMYPSKEEALVRNVDLPIFGRDRARSMVDLRSEEDAENVRAELASGEISVFYIHLAEGLDDSSRAELDKLEGFGLLREETVIIHGTALSEEQLGRVRDAGAKLVWSPQSNLRLYGQTTRAAHAISLGIPVGLGSDWLPSGSPSLLSELKVARRVLGQQGASRTPKHLVEMVTKEAARIADLQEFVGTLEAGKVADVLVLERRREDPWENVLDAERSWVELVTIGGNPVYGRPDLMRELAGDSGEAEEVLAWGKPMLLDTNYAAAPSGETLPRLAELREQLIGRYPQIGPIFA